VAEESPGAIKFLAESLGREDQWTLSDKPHNPGERAERRWRAVRFPVGDGIWIHAKRSGILSLAEA